jgi:hypothetical protein|nr:MAG TPA: hypothetical protein [Caudoviricetes sp.]
MEKININALANNRKPLSNMGALFGCQYFKAELREHDTNFTKRELQTKQNGNIDLMPNRTIHRYRMTDFDVVSINFVTNPDGSNSVIFNMGTDDEVVLPVDSNMTQVGEVNENALKESLRGDNKNVIFANPENLAAMLNRMNQAEINRAESLIKELETAIKQARRAMDENQKKVETYMSQMVNSTPAPMSRGTEVNINIKTTEE